MSSSVIVLFERLPFRLAHMLCHVCVHAVHLRTHALPFVVSPHGHLDRAGPLGFSAVSWLSVGDPLGCLVSGEGALGALRDGLF